VAAALQKDAVVLTAVGLDCSAFPGSASQPGGDLPSRLFTAPATTHPPPLAKHLQLPVPPAAADESEAAASGSQRTVQVHGMPAEALEGGGDPSAFYYHRSLLPQVLITMVRSLNRLGAAPFQVHLLSIAGTMMSEFTRAAAAWCLVWGGLGTVSWAMWSCCGAAPAGTAAVLRWYCGGTAWL